MTQDSAEAMAREVTSGSGATDDAELDRFWQVARVRAKLNRLQVYLGPNTMDSLRPPAWAFGVTPTQADALLALVLDGTKTATAGALWDYEHEGEDVARVGDLAILLDGGGQPRALIGVTGVRVVPFREVSAEHAYAEGEGDRSLAHWRAVHEQFFTEVATHGKGFSLDMPVVCETFEVLYQT